jgi:hypothetical protein
MQNIQNQLIPQLNSKAVVRRPKQFDADIAYLDIQ